MKALNDIRAARKLIRDTPDYMDRELSELLSQVESAVRKALQRARSLGMFTEVASQDLVVGDRVITDGDVGTVSDDCTTILETTGTKFPVRANAEDLFLVARSPESIADWNSRREASREKFGA